MYFFLAASPLSPSAHLGCLHARTKQPCDAVHTVKCYCNYKSATYFPLLLASNSRGTSSVVMLYLKQQRETVLFPPFKTNNLTTSILEDLREGSEEPSLQDHEREDFLLTELDKCCILLSLKLFLI